MQEVQASEMRHFLEQKRMLSQGSWNSVCMKRADFVAGDCTVVAWESLTLRHSLFTAYIHVSKLFAQVMTATCLLH
jgi:hypothetical protein